jgi:uridine phosphorylase
MTQERFTPHMYVDYYARQRGISVRDIGVTPVVVLSWGRGVIESLAEAVGAQPAPHWFYDEYQKFFTGEVQGQAVSFAHAPVGAPGTVMMMEEMIACGARIFLGLGWAGSLQEVAPVGTMLIPTGCIRDEGTSFHYVGDEVKLSADRRLTASLESAAQAEGVRIMTGRQWTTDAPYREFTSQIAAYREQGVLGVDMETSAMYALGQFRKVRVCNLLVVSDELWGSWRPAFRTSELREATELAQRVILKCLERDLEPERRRLG